MSGKKQKDALWNICQKFIVDLEISCPESIYQSDRIAENSLELIEEICKVIGYHQFEDEK